MTKYEPLFLFYGQENFSRQQLEQAIQDAKKITGSKKPKVYRKAAISLLLGERLQSSSE